MPASFSSIHSSAQGVNVPKHLPGQLSRKAHLHHLGHPVSSMQ
jgi:hypothetical protein